MWRGLHPSSLPGVPLGVPFKLALRPARCEPFLSFSGVPFLSFSRAPFLSFSGLPFLSFSGVPEAGRGADPAFRISWSARSFSSGSFFTWCKRGVMFSWSEWGVAFSRKVDVRPPGKGNSKSHGARRVHLTITMTTWIRTGRLSIKNSLFRWWGCGCGFQGAGFRRVKGEGVWSLHRPVGECGAAFGFRVYRGTSLIKKHPPPNGG